MRLVVLVAVLALSAGPLAGQEVRRLTLGELVELALRTSPTVAAATNALAGAVSGVGEVRSQRLPQVGVDGSLVRFAEPMVVAPIHGFSPDRIPEFDRTLFQASVAAGFTLWDGGHRGARIREAGSFADAADAQRDAAEEAVVLAVVRAYVAVLAGRGTLDAQEMRQQALEAEAGRVRQFLAEGRAARVDSLRVAAALAQAEADRATAGGQLEVAESELARLAGLEPGSTPANRLAPVGPVPTPVPSRDSLDAVMRHRNPALRAAADRVAGAESAVRRTHAAWFPTLRLEGRLIHYGAADAPGATEWQSGLRLAWPLFTGGQRLAAADRSQAALREAEAMLRQEELVAMTRLDRALAAADEAERRVAALARAADHLEEVVRVEALSLAQGAGTTSEYLRAEADLAGARAALVHARSAEVAARTEVAWVVGGLSAASLTRIVRTEP